MATGRSWETFRGTWRVKAKIKEAKDGYRRKLERKLQQNNMREVWSGMRTITGFRPTSSGVDGNVARANEICSSIGLILQPWPLLALLSTVSRHHCFRPPLPLLIASHPTVWSPHTHPPLITPPLAPMLPALFALWIPTLPLPSLHCLHLFM